MQTYTANDDVYNSFPVKLLPFTPDVIITEDSNSGFQFFDHIAKENGIECISAGGKSNIDSLINKYADKKLVVIADGAAFGPDMRTLVQRQRLSNNKLAIYLPESFEWIVLESGLVCDPGWENVAIPEKYIDSAMYVSWERYFTDLLISVTADSDYQKYSKHSLPEFYFHEKSVQRIKETIKGLKL